MPAAFTNSTRFERDCPTDGCHASISISLECIRNLDEPYVRCQSGDVLDVSLLKARLEFYEAGATSGAVMETIVAGILRDGWAILGH